MKYCLRWLVAAAAAAAAAAADFPPANSNVRPGGSPKRRLFDDPLALPDGPFLYRGPQPLAGSIFTTGGAYELPVTCSLAQIGPDVFTLTAALPDVGDARFELAAGPDGSFRVIPPRFAPHALSARSRAIYDYVAALAGVEFERDHVVLLSRAGPPARLLRTPVPQSEWLLDTGLAGAEAQPLTLAGMAAPLLQLPLSLAYLGGTNSVSPLAPGRYGVEVLHPQFQDRYFTFSLERDGRVVDLRQAGTGPVDLSLGAFGNLGQFINEGARLAYVRETDAVQVTLLTGDQVQLQRRPVGRAALVDRLLGCSSDAIFVDVPSGLLTCNRGPFSMARNLVRTVGGAIANAVDTLQAVIPGADAELGGADTGPVATGTVPDAGAVPSPDTMPIVDKSADEQMTGADTIRVSVAATTVDGLPFAAGRSAVDEAAAVAASGAVRFELIPESYTGPAPLFSSGAGVGTVLPVELDLQLLAPDRVKLTHTVINTIGCELTFDEADGRVTAATPGVSTMKAGLPVLMHAERVISDHVCNARQMAFSPDGDLIFVHPRGTELRFRQASPGRHPMARIDAYKLFISEIVARDGSIGPPLAVPVVAEFRHIAPGSVEIDTKISNAISAVLAFDPASGVRTAPPMVRSTRMLGPPEAQRAEVALIEALEEFRRIEFIQGAEVNVFNGGGRRVLRFTARAPARRLQGAEAEGAGGGAGGGAGAASLGAGYADADSGAGGGAVAAAQAAAQFGSTSYEKRVTELVHSRVRDLVPTYLPTAVVETRVTLVPTMEPALVSRMRHVAYTTLVPMQYERLVPTLYPALVRGTAVSYVERLAPQLVPTMVPRVYPTLVPATATGFVTRMVDRRVESLVPRTVSRATEEWREQQFPETVRRAFPTLVPAVVPATATRWATRMVPHSVPERYATLVPTLVPGTVTTLVPTMVSRVVSTWIPTLVPRMVEGTRIVMRPERYAEEFHTFATTLVPRLVDVDVPTMVSRMVRETVQRPYVTLVPHVSYVAEPRVFPTSFETLVPRLASTWVPATAVKMRSTVVAETRETLVRTFVPGTARAVVNTLVPQLRHTVVSTLVPTTVQRLVPREVAEMRQTYYSTLVPTMVDALVPRETTALAKHCHARPVKFDVDLARLRVNGAPVPPVHAPTLFGVFRNACDGYIFLALAGREFRVAVREDGRVVNVAAADGFAGGAAGAGYGVAQLVFNVIRNAEFMRLDAAALAIFAHGGSSVVILRFYE